MIIRLIKNDQELREYDLAKKLETFSFGEGKITDKLFTNEHAPNILIQIH